MRWRASDIAALKRRIRTVTGRVPVIARTRTGVEREMRINRTDRMLEWASGSNETPLELRGEGARFWIVALAPAPGARPGAPS